jgi:non-specific serine/threonine protein kinase
MLETVREYGVEQLEASGEAEEIRRQHAAYFARVAEEGAAGLRGPEEFLWTTRLEAEHDNFRVALAWLIANDATAAWILASALVQFWYATSYLSEGRRWLDQVLALPNANVPFVTYNQVLEWAGLLAHYQGDYLQAKTLLTQALASARDAENAGRIAFVLEALGIVAEDTGAYDEATELLTEAITGLRRAGERYEESIAHFHLGVVLYGRGDFAQAEAEAHAARTLGQEVGNAAARWLGALLLAHVAIEAGDWQHAARWFRETLRITDEPGGIVALWQRGNLEGVARLIAGVALLAAAQGEPVRAARLFGMAEAARAPIGLMPALPESAVYDRAIQAAREAIGDTAFTQALNEGRSASPELVLAEVEAALREASGIPE